jgi:hypothetical protein
MITLNLQTVIPAHAGIHTEYLKRRTPHRRELSMGPGVRRGDGSHSNE